MGKKHNPETDEQRNKRVEKESQRREADAAAEDKAIDTMVRRSIERHGP